MNWDKLFFSGWNQPLRVLIVGTLAYWILILFLRITGKRTLAKMNAFDLVVTVALGSTLATILLNNDVSLAEGTVALGLLVGLQFVVTWTSVRVSWVRRLVTGEPRMLFFQGQFLQKAMREDRVTEDEVRAAIRAQGIESLTAVEAVVLETDGSFSVVSSGEKNPKTATSLQGVEVGPEAQPLMSERLQEATVASSDV